ncbi:hypothetical protein D9C73_010367 [Collichthys lucidus]|uniref:Uncharacterized protein n=1 Tax=Collichthys lucidus TaxID=240159 RepID=A0A4V6AQE4_COLLU|nr:hypothetical protein D9C73_010367 [Collichthys lucidus]
MMMPEGEYAVRAVHEFKGLEGTSHSKEEYHNPPPTLALSCPLSYIVFFPPVTNIAAYSRSSTASRREFRAHLDEVITLKSRYSTLDQALALPPEEEEEEEEDSSLDCHSSILYCPLPLCHYHSSVLSSAPSLPLPCPGGVGPLISLADLHDNPSSGCFRGDDGVGV